MTDDLPRASGQYALGFGLVSEQVDSLAEKRR